MRHRTKYLDVPMQLEHAFVFTCNGHPIRTTARTLKEFVTLQARLPLPQPWKVMRDAAIFLVGLETFSAMNLSLFKSGRWKKIFGRAG